MITLVGVLSSPHLQLSSFLHNCLLFYACQCDSKYLETLLQFYFCFQWFHSKLLFSVIIFMSLAFMKKLMSTFSYVLHSRHIGPVGPTLHVDSTLSSDVGTRVGTFPELITMG